MIAARVKIAFMEKAERAGSATELAALRVDARGTVAELDAAWQRRLDEHGVTILRAEEILGRPLDDFLDERLAEKWRSLLPCLLSQDGPPPFSHPLLARLRPWPAPNGVWLSLDWPLRSWLARPLLRLEKGRARPCNRAAHQLLDSDIDPSLSELRHLESFLESRSSPLRLVAVPGLRYRGRALFTVSRPSIYEIDAFDLLARIVRAGLHDLSNPLSAMRMMAGVAAHGAGLSAAAPASLQDMTGHLDAAIHTIHDLRSLVHADSSAAELDIEAELRLAASLLRSELSRRDLELECRIAPGAVAVAGRNAFRLLVTAGLFSTCGRAAPGGRLLLSWDEPDGAGKLLSCHLDANGPPPLADETPGIDLLRRLAASCDGRFKIRPGERPGGDPDWQIELADA